MPIRNWGLTMQQLHIKFGEKFKAFGNPKRSEMTQFNLHYPYILSKLIYHNKIFRIQTACPEDDEDVAIMMDIKRMICRSLLFINIEAISNHQTLMPPHIGYICFHRTAR